MTNQINNNFIQQYLIVLLIIAGLLIWAVFAFLGTLSSTLKCIAPQNRTMNPGQVFLLLIPVFNYIWMFILVSRISESIENELRSRNIPHEKKPTYSIGLTYAIISLTNVLVQYMYPYGFFLNKPFLWVATIACAISYWVSVSNMKNKLQALGYGNNFTSSGMNNNQYNNNNNNQGYQGGYSGGHNNPNNSNSSSPYNPTQCNNNNDGEYKSGDLYK